MSLFSFLNKKELNLIIDIGSSTVSTAMVSFEKGKAPLVLALKKTDIEFLKDISFDRLQALMIKSLDISIKEVLTKVGKRPVSAYCFLASPWYASQIRKVKVKKDRDFIFTRELFKELTLKEKQSFFNYSSTEYGKFKDNSVFIEQKAIDIKINGYRVDNPFDLKTKEVDITFIFGVATESVVNLVKEKIDSIIPETNIVFHTFLLPFFNTIRNLYKESRDFMLIDIGGEVADISIVRDHVLTESISFPMGRNFLLRKFSTNMKKEMEESRSLVRLFSEGRLDKETQEKVSEALDPIKNEWLRVFHESIKDIVNMLLLPDLVYITADKDVVSWFINSIETEEYGQYTLSANKFKVTPINTNSMDGHVLFNDTIIERDEFLSIESLFVKDALLERNK